MNRLSSESLAELAKAIQEALPARQSAVAWKGSRHDRVYINESGRKSERCYYDINAAELTAYRYGSNHYCFPGGAFEPGRCDDYGGSALLEKGYRVLRGN